MNGPGEDIRAALAEERLLYRERIQSIRREEDMLVITRKVDEAIVIGDIRIVVTQVQGDKVKLGIEAPPETRIDREEIAIRRKNEQGDAV
jgi:carbon storage regulator